MTENELLFYQEKAKIPETSRGSLARQISFLEERFATLGSKEEKEEYAQTSLLPSSTQRDITTQIRPQGTLQPSLSLPPLQELKQQQRKLQKKQLISELQHQLDVPPVSPVKGANNYVAPQKRSEAPIESSSVGKTWIPLGPFAVLRGQGGMDANGLRPTMSGRVEDIEVAPGGKRIYIASANGGVWRSEDAGKSWRCLMENFDLNPTVQGTDTLACGAIALVAGAATDKDRLYVGTGGTVLNGVGPLLSMDGGEHWEVEPSEPSLVGQRFYALAVDPMNPLHVVAATSNGLYQRRLDEKGNGSWRATLEYIAGYGCYGKDVVAVYDKNKKVTIFYAVVMFYAGTWRTSIYSSTNGMNWNLLDQGFPSASTDGNGVVAVQVNNPSIVYAFLGVGEGKLPEFYRLEVNTGTWRKIDMNFPPSARFKWYLEMAVDPNNVNRIYLAGNTVYVDGFCGEVYRCDIVEKSGRLTATATYIGTSTHADAHTLVFAPNDSNKLWLATDGGVFYSSQPTGEDYVFEACNTGLATFTMNYLGQHPTEDAILFCGTQDNGGVRFTGDEAWDYVSGGDSGYFVVNWYDPSKVLDTYTYNLVRISTQGGERDSFWWDVKVPIEEGESSLFYAPLVGTPYHPALLNTSPEAAKKEADLVAFGSERPWISTSFGEHWQSIPTGTRKGDTLNARIRSLTFASANILYVGTLKGGIYRFDKTGNQWQRTRLDDQGGMPNQLSLPVTDIALDPLDETGRSIYITFGGSGDFRHVWHFDGKAWEARSGQEAPLLDIQYNAIVVDPVEKTYLYVGADIGVWRSTDEGKHWEPFSKGLPDAAVMDLQIHPTHRLLRASTFGRGVFELPLDEVQQREVNLYIRSTILDRGLYPIQENSPDPLHPGQFLNHRNSPDIKLSLPNEKGDFPLAENINFEQFTNILVDCAQESFSSDPIRVYVKVHNRGTQSAHGVSIMLMGAALENDSPPLLPMGFAGDVQDDDQLSSKQWKTLGTQKVNEVRTSFPKVVCFNLSSRQLGSGAYCLLACAYSPEDPFNATERQPHQLCFSERKVAMKYLKLPMVLQTSPAVLQFDGVNSYVNLGTSLQITGSQTIEMWINPQSFETRQNPFAKAYGGEGSMTIEPNGTVTYYYGTCGDNAKPYQEVNTLKALLKGTWSHLALIRNLETKTISWYINGEKVNQEPAQFAQAKASKLPALLGKGYKNCFCGFLAEVRFWKEARSQKDIQANLYRSLVGNEKNLVAYYRLNEGSGTNILDLVSKEARPLEGCRWAQSTLPVSPKVKILLFDGANHIDLGNPSALQIIGDQTIEMWIKPLTFERRQNPLSKAYGGEVTLTLEKEGSLTYYYGTAGNNGSPYQGVSSQRALVLNVWSHIALVRTLTSQTLIWYINGEKVSENKMLYPKAKTSSLPVLLGKGYLANFKGYLTEVRFWNKARSHEEIKTDMKQVLTGTELGLVAYYRLNEGLGGTVTDLVAKMQGKIQGNSLWQEGDFPFKG